MSKSERVRLSDGMAHVAQRKTSVALRATPYRSGHPLKQSALVPRCFLQSAFSGKGRSGALECVRQVPRPLQFVLFVHLRIRRGY